MIIFVLQLTLSNSYWTYVICGIMDSDLHQAVACRQVSPFHYLSQWRPSSMIVITLHCIFDATKNRNIFEHDSYADHSGYKALSQQWLRQCFSAVRQQAIAWAKHWLGCTNISNHIHAHTSYIYKPTYACACIRTLIFLHNCIINTNYLAKHNMYEIVSGNGHGHSQMVSRGQRQPCRTLDLVMTRCHCGFQKALRGIKPIFHRINRSKRLSILISKRLRFDITQFK